MAPGNEESIKKELKDIVKRISMGMVTQERIFSAIELFELNK